MAVIIAKNFFPAVAALQPEEQAQTLSFLLQFQANPANPGISLERVNNSGHGIWSARINRDLRAIVHKDGDIWAMLYADHHDAAYRWAERRQAGRNPHTGVLQIVETVETVREITKTIIVPQVVQAAAPPTFEKHADDYLLSLGVPEPWMPAVRSVSNADQLVELCTRLPGDVGDRLFDVAAGDLVTPPTPVPLTEPVTAAPDLQQSFFVAEDEADLRAALDAPMQHWMRFLHPSQQALVTRRFSGPAKVSGSAGTGKTVVAMHRARHLARQGKRVLLTSYVTTLCDNLAHNLDLLCRAADVRARIEVKTIHAVAVGLVAPVDRGVDFVRDHEMHALLADLTRRHGLKFDAGFVQAEWDGVVELQGLSTWKAYRGAERTGRGTPLSIRDRKALWDVFEAARQQLRTRGKSTFSSVCVRATALLESDEAQSPYDAVLVDEVQDLRAPQLRLVRALVSEDPGLLMVVGDAGQRIYPGGFSLSRLGIEVRGRAKVLRINYRTTEQIRRASDRVNLTESDDLDGGVERRDRTRSLLHGPEPLLKPVSDPEAELDQAVEHVRGWLAQGLQSEAIAIFARERHQVEAVVDHLRRAELTAHPLLDKDARGERDGIQVGTMHRAKGLEFKVVLVMGCSASQVPNQRVLRGIDDPKDRDDAIERERRLLYVAMTRARDELVISWSGAPSTFLEPLTATAKQ